MPQELFLRPWLVLVIVPFFLCVLILNLFTTRRKWTTETHIRQARRTQPTTVLVAITCPHPLCRAGQLCSGQGRSTHSTFHSR
jgi:hypothetical protein